MRRSTSLVAALAVCAIALAPSLGFARAGGGASMGSRGSMTYSAPPSTRTSPGYAAPMERSMTPSAPSYGTPAPSYANRGVGAPAFGGRSPFMSGLMGGLIGAGIGGMLFGHGMFGGIDGIGGFLGLLVQIFLVVVLVRFAFRFFARRNAPATAGGPNIFARSAMGAGPAPMGGGASRPAAPAVGSVAIGPQDFESFERTLKDVQAAWTAHDLPRLQGLSTPEMVSYFSEQLSEQSSRGVRNTVADVKLESGDLAQSWSEDGRDYATVAMRFSMVDFTRDSSGRVVDGDPETRTMATEIWTFVRARTGGRWLLSAIQQTR